MVDPAALAAERSAYVVAAAGCGKTELIADSVGVTAGRSLVLTHTHAGVGALRSRLRRKRVTREQCSVETLDGFALRFAAAYPATSGWAGTQPTPTDWPAVQQAATHLLSTPTGEQILASSYDGVYVDEYQDCTATQHQLVLRIAGVLPTRVLGDPLQGIFGFVGDHLDWNDVYGRFTNAGVLETPHRWAQTNPALGEWLIDARHRLLAGLEPDWDAQVVVSRPWSPAAEVDACKRLASTEGVVALRRFPRDEHRIASLLGGDFTTIEPIAAQDLFEAIADLEDAKGTDLALRTLDVAAQSMTKVNATLRAARTRLVKGQLPVARSGSAVENAANTLRAVVEDGLDRVPDALNAIEALPAVKLYRSELLREITRAIRARGPGSERTLKEIAWQLRDGARRQGRTVPTRVVSRTLLVKGLEFEHGIVLKRGELPTEDLYVAITRPRRSLTVLLGT